jgi:hypothetical protein
MFRTVFLSITRSLRLYIQHQVYVITESMAAYYQAATELHGELDRRTDAKRLKPKKVTLITSLFACKL